MSHADRSAVRVEVPDRGRDRPAWGKVGVIALLGFVIGVAWPRVAGVRLGPKAPGEGAQAAHWLAQSLAQQTDAGRLTIFQIGRLWMAARLATAQQQYQRAAMLFGLADEMHRQLHYVIAGPMRALADEAFATAQAALEPAVFIEAFSAGQQLPLEEAFATLLTPPTVAP